MDNERKMIHFPAGSVGDGPAGDSGRNNAAELDGLAAAADRRSSPPAPARSGIANRPIQAAGGATCGRRLKTCRKCKHRYVKGDKAWRCPSCGEPRGCTNMPVNGATACRLHGGRSLSGIANPAFRHGRYSSVLPENLLGSYREALADPELISARDDIALLAVRLRSLLEQLEPNGPADLWIELKDVWVEAKSAIAAGDTQALGAALNAAGTIIDRGAGQLVIWREIDKAIHSRTQVAMAEHKRLVEMEQMMTREQGTALVAAVIDAVRSEVSDKVTLCQIGRKLGAILRLPNMADDDAALPAGEDAAEAGEPCDDGDGEETAILVESACRDPR